MTASGMLLQFLIQFKTERRRACQRIPGGIMGVCVQAQAGL